MLDHPVAYERIPYFYSDQYDVGMEYSGHAVDWDEIVFRGDVAPREFIAFWRKDERILAGMNVNGLISFECTPDLADDTDGTLAQAKDLWQRLDRPNVMIKVPGTEAGLPAIEELARSGVNVNITLLFSIERYEDVIDAYLRGLTARVKDGQPIDHITSVASFFLSRIDTKVDKQLPEDSPLRGQVAVASARVAYQRFLRKFSGPAWDELRAKGAKLQLPLWASTGTKNPAYSDTLYVADLVGPDVVNTMPEQTLKAFADHGEVARTLDADPDEAAATLAAAKDAGIDLTAVTDELEREGVQSFSAFIRRAQRQADREQALGRRRWRIVG